MVQLLIEYYKAMKRHYFHLLECRKKNQKTAFTSPRILRAGKYNVLFFIDCRAIKELANNHITK